MSAMNENRSPKKTAFHSAKEIAYIGLFSALLIGGQLAFSFFPGVEIVTALFVSYSFVFGRIRGMAVATVFSVLRQLLFGFFPNVFVLYLIYYHLLAFGLGSIGKKYGAEPKRKLWLVLLCSCLYCVLFTVFDDLITPLWYGYSQRARTAYIVASLPVMGAQTLCVGITTGILFLPLNKTFRLIAKPSGMKING